MIEILDHQIDAVRLRTEVEQIERDVRYSAFNQIALKSRPGIENPVHDGCDTIYDRENGRWLAREDEFIETTPPFKGTYLADIVSWFAPCGRARLMQLSPKVCYSMHVDDGFRIHVPIITNPNCYIFYQGEVPVHLPVGSIYKMDARSPHTAMNASTERRVHLVINLLNDS